MLLPSPFLDSSSIREGGSTQQYHIIVSAALRTTPNYSGRDCGVCAPTMVWPGAALFSLLTCTVILSCATTTVRCRRLDHALRHSMMGTSWPHFLARHAYFLVPREDVPLLLFVAYSTNLASSCLCRQLATA